MPCSVTILWLISSTRLENEKSAFVDIQIASLSRRWQYSRFNPQHIAHSPRLVPVLLVCLPNRVDIVDAHNPFLLCELDLSAEVVQVLDQAAEDLSVSGLRLGGHQVDDMLGEERVEFAALILAGPIGAVGTVCSHCGCDIAV